jgi:6-phospho-3-hexuloisomerase
MKTARKSSAAPPPAFTASADTVDSPHAAALVEVAAVLDATNEADVAALCLAIAQARKIVLFGCGREMLQMRGFAMRLFHLGCDVAVAGDINTPAIGANDLFLASAGPGELATVLALCRKARAAGATVAMITGVPGSPAAHAADRVLILPAQTMANDHAGAARSVLPMGSLYEGAMFMLFEMMVERLKPMLGQTAETMRARHTTLE